MSPKRISVALSLAMLVGCVTPHTHPHTHPGPAPGGGPGQPSPSTDGGFGGQELDGCEIVVLPRQTPIMTVQVQENVPNGWVSFMVRVEKDVEMHLDGQAGPDGSPWLELDDWQKEIHVKFTGLSDPTAQPQVEVFEVDIAGGTSTSEYGPQNVDTFGQFDPNLIPRTPFVISQLPAYPSGPQAKKTVLVRYDFHGRVVAFTINGSH